MNWNKVSDLKPPACADILFITNDGRLFLGEASYIESWDIKDGEQVNYKKWATFKPHIFLKERECCDYDDPIEIEFAERCYSFNEDNVEYWARVITPKFK